MSIAGAMSGIARVKRILRWTDWAQSKIPLLCSASAFVYLSRESIAASSALEVVVFLFVFASSNAAFGYLINDLGDREIDREQGKSNVLAELRRTSTFRLLAAVIAVMAVSGLMFISSPGFLLLWLAFVLLTAAYSLPPLRLKTTGWPGLIASSLAQCTIPLSLVFVTLSPDSLRSGGALVFIVGGTLMGTSLELAHQRFDRSQDAATATFTLAVGLRGQTLDRICWWALWTDRLAVGVIVYTAVLSVAASGARWIGVGLILMYLVALVNITVRLTQGTEIDPYYGQRNLADRLVHHMLPGTFLPVFLLASVSLESVFWSIPLIFFVMWKLILPNVA